MPVGYLLTSKGRPSPIDVIAYPRGIASAVAGVIPFTKQYKDGWTKSKTCLLEPGCQSLSLSGTFSISSAAVSKTSLTSASIMSSAYHAPSIGEETIPCSCLFTKSFNSSNKVSN